MKIYNSLTRRIEEFKPIQKGQVGIYTCGPTIYDYAHIGNFRTYFTSDLVVRFFKHIGYDVKFVMNLTDVGHLTGDNSGDADTGIDRMEKGASRENKTAWDIAKFYEKAFLIDFERMNYIKPFIFPKPTDHIDEQIDMVQKLFDRNLAYEIQDGVYFDTKAFENLGFKYGELSDLDKIKEGARVEPNPNKRDPRDFALWKKSENPGERHMEWNSPWGIGFPGWHIECSAMSTKYLGETFDIHIGGEDLRQTHHPNEIAQSEGATDKKFVNYWIHSAFLKVDNKRMGKSMGNAYTLDQIIEKGFSPLDLRYFYMSAHYRDVLNFTWEGLTAARNAREKLNNYVLSLQKGRSNLHSEKNNKRQEFYEKFNEAIGDDLNMPKAVAALWEMLKSNISEEDKLDLVYSFDEIFGLNLRDIKEEEISDEVKVLIAKREEYRKNKEFAKADEIRDELIRLGVKTSDDKI